MEETKATVYIHILAKFSPNVSKNFNEFFLMKVYCDVFTHTQSDQFRQELVSCHVNFNNLSLYYISRHYSYKNLENLIYFLYLKEIKIEPKISIKQSLDVASEFPTQQIFHHSILPC